MDGGRWAAFSDEEIRALEHEITVDDGIVYGFSPGDEPMHSLHRELVDELKRRGLDYPGL